MIKGAGFSPVGLSSPGMGHIVDSPNSMSLGNINNYQAMDNTILQNGAGAAGGNQGTITLSKLRLFAVVHKVSPQIFNYDVYFE